MKPESIVAKPRYCCWVLNYRCMFRCRMCHIWNTGNSEAMETSFEEKKRFVASLSSLVEKDFEFHLSGGEPLMSPDILELISFIHSRGYRTNMVTNGFLIDEDMARALAGSGLNSLTFSLDGLRAETHDFIRGMPGSHERIMQAIAYLEKYRKNNGLEISVLTTIMERNLEEIPRLVEWVQNDERIKMVSFQAVTQPFGESADPEWQTREKNRILWPQDTQRAAAVMEELRGLKLNNRKIGNHPDHFLHFREYFKEPERFLKKLKCNLGDYEFHIDPYGKAFFCCLMEPFGNIKTHNVAEAWYLPQTQAIREQVYRCRKNCHIMINCFYEEESL